MPKLAVIGHPVAHSRSPVMQNAALRELGLADEWEYGALDIDPDEVAERVAALPGDGYAGVNVTIPHKVAAAELADEVSDAAREIGAANTLLFRDGRIEADNTDATGLLDAMPQPPAGGVALVVGAGGSARACVWALLRAGAQVEIFNRTRDRARSLAEELGARVSAAEETDGRPSPDGYDIVVNCTTIGMDAANPASTEGQTPSESGTADLKAVPIDADRLKAGQVVIDLVYGTRDTALIQAARGAGAEAVDGLEFLVRQGAASLKLWTGIDAPVDVMRDALRDSQRTDR